MPKVGQWGQLNLRVVYYKDITSKSSKTTPNQRLELLTRDLQMLQCLQNTQIDTKIQKIQQDVSEVNTLAKHAPIALTLLDRLHWQP